MKAAGKCGKIFINKIKKEARLSRNFSIQTNRFFGTRAFVVKATGFWFSGPDSTLLSG